MNCLEKVFYSHIYHRILISPFSKNSILFSIPSTLYRRHISSDLTIIKAQILRVWRLCNEDLPFSKCISDYLEILLDNRYFQRIRSHILSLLSPIYIRRNIWTTNIPLCPQCINKLVENNINIQKYILLDFKLLCPKESLRCISKNVSII
jgi:hypothetical protein